MKKSAFIIISIIFIFLIGSLVIWILSSDKKEAKANDNFQQETIIDETTEDPTTTSTTEITETDTEDFQTEDQITTEATSNEPTQEEITQEEEEEDYSIYEELGVPAATHEYRPITEIEELPNIEDYFIDGIFDIENYLYDCGGSYWTETLSGEVTCYCVNFGHWGLLIYTQYYNGIIPEFYLTNFSEKYAFDFSEDENMRNFQPVNSGSVSLATIYALPDIISGIQERELSGSPDNYPDVVGFIRH